MEDFNTTIIKALVQQLVEGYRFKDQYGNTYNDESPLQSLLSKCVYDNRDIILAKVAEILKGEGFIDNATNKAVFSLLNSYGIQDELRDELSKKIADIMMEKMMTQFGSLLAGKELKITIE